METSALEDEEISPGLPEPDLDPLTAGKRAFLIRKVSRPRDCKPRRLLLFSKWLARMHHCE
jgi:hypothetical protein